MGRAEINYCVYLTVTGSAIISLRSSLHDTPTPTLPPERAPFLERPLRSPRNTLSALRLGAGEGIFQALDYGMHMKGAEHSWAVLTIKPRLIYQRLAAVGEFLCKLGDQIF